MSNPFKSLFKQTAVYGLSSIIGRFLNYLLVPLYTAIFTNPAEYGVVSELYAWVAFLIVILTFGMETAFFRFFESSEDKKSIFKNTLWTVLIVNALFLVTILLFHENFAALMLFEDHSEYLVLLSFIVVLDALSALPLAKLRQEQRAIRFSGIQLSSILVNIVLNLLFMLVFFNEDRPEEGVLFILIANLIASAIKPILLFKDYSVLIEKPDKQVLKKIMVYAFPLVLAGFAGIINETLDRIMLKHILYDPTNPSSLEFAEGQVGIYSACYKLAMMVTIFIQAYRYAAEPFFFRQINNENRNNIYVKVMNIFVAIVGCFFLLVSINIDVFKYFIQNKVYWEGLSIVPVLLLANVFFGIYINQSIWYKLSGQTKYGLYIAIIGAVITIVGNYIFIPHYGFVASAWVTLVVYTLQMLVSYIWGQIHYPIPYNIPRILSYLAMALIIYLIFCLLPFENKIINLLLGNFLTMGYLTFIYFVERKSLKSSY